MNNLSDSLSGKNLARTAGGVRSSRTRSSLLNKLRKLDRELTKLRLKIEDGEYWNEFYSRLKTKPEKATTKHLNKLKEKFKKLDEQRKQVRNIRKGYFFKPNE